MIINKIYGRSIKKISVITVITFITFITGPKPTTAQTVSLAVWPPLLDTVIKPGKAITQVYKLQNFGDDTMIRASIVPFEPADESGHTKIINNSQLTIDNYFSLQNANLAELPATFPLKSGQTQELVLKISVPEAAPEAEYYATFLFESTTEGLISGSGAVTNASIGANILLTVSRTGELNPTAKIEEFSTVRWLDSFSPINFRLRVKNTSLNRLQAVGQIEIKNIFGAVSTTLPLRQDNILAGTIRRLSLEKEWRPVFPIGRFTAAAAITPLNTTNTVSQTIAFVVLPYKLLLAVCLLTSIYFYYYFKYRVKKNR